ncbi:MAG TPA: sigma-70 family RNA polymerase sigma factor [Solirubrobacteraceae bacterium]|nr:sigma-70 family RNA polymerase sigma factor [Solirubrobacteraceae bacterium]
MEGQAQAGRSRATVRDQRASVPTAGAAPAAGAAVSRAVKRAQAGDRDALAFLYMRFADDICRYARSIVHDHHEAEDVTQQVFAKLTRVIGKYQERDVPFLAWMLRVTRNVSLDHLRKQNPLPVEDLRADDRNVRDAPADDQLSELTAALATLPHAQREVLVLRHFAGLSPTEIAERVGKSEGSIHGLHHRGRRSLIAELTERGAAPSTRAGLLAP